MRILTMMLLSVIVLGAVACNSNALTPSSPQGELFIFNADTGVQIASGSARGTLSVEVFDVRNLRVIRRITENDGSFTDTNITATTADFNVENTDVVTVSNDPGSEGVLTARSVGSTELEIRHRGANPTNDDFAYIDITVTAP